MINDLDSADFISWNIHSSRQEALLYVFEDNEAVIKMIIKDRSPTMRHVSRTHRVALDWLFDRINLDPKIQIKYTDTKKTTRRHTDQVKFHTWWMESSFVFVQHQPFVPPIVLKLCRKERKKMQVKKESQQNRSRWWIWSRDRACGIQTCLPLPHQNARWKPDMKVKYLWARGMSSNQERRDLWLALAHQTTQNVTLTTSALLKSGNLVKCWKQERGDPRVGNRSLSTQTSLSLMTMIWTLTPPQNRTYH